MINIILGGASQHWSHRVVVGDFPAGCVCGWAGGPTETVCPTVCVSEVALEIWESGCMGGGMRSAPDRHGR